MCVAVFTKYKKAAETMLYIPTCWGALQTFSQCCFFFSDQIVTWSEFNLPEAASPADVVLLKWVGVCFLGTGAGGAADTSVVRVNAEAGLDHHHTVMILVAAWWICEGKEEQKQISVFHSALFSTLFCLAPIAGWSHRISCWKCWC